MRRARIAALAAVCAALLAVAGCSPERGATADWPTGTLVIARTDALQALLARLTRLEGTPLARRAAEVATELPDCAWVEARQATGPAAGVLSQLRCRGDASAYPGLDRERAGRDLAFALPSDGDQRVFGSLAIAADGDVDVEILLPRSTFASARALLVPSGEPPEPEVLSHAGELVHARMRPAGGLDIASLVSPTSQADQMFRLRSRLFAGAVLNGTWEAAIYLPDEGRPMPHAALAVGFSHAGPAIAAMESFVSDLEAVWPVRRSGFAVGAARGLCLLELKLLPDLAPCYVATDRALVVGWNPASLRVALADGKDSQASEPAHPNGGIVIELERFPEADARLARLVAQEPAPRPTGPYPWRRITADGEREGDDVRLRVRLEAGVGA